MKDVFEDGLRRHGDLPADLPEGVVHGGLQHHRAQRARWPRSTPASSSSTPAGTRVRATPAWRSSKQNVERYGLDGRQALHRRVAGGLARLDAQGPGGVPVPGEVPGARHQEHPRPQGPDDLAAGQGRVRRVRRRPRGDRLPRAELHRRARRPAPDRGLLLHGDAGAERLRRAVGRDRRPDARPAEVLRQGDGRAAVLGRRGQDDLRQRLRHLGAEVAGRGLRRLGLSRTTRSSPTTRGSASRARRRSSGSTRRSSTASRCRTSASSRTRSRRHRTTRSWSTTVMTAAVIGAVPGPRRAGHGARPGAGRAGHRRSGSSRRAPCRRPATSQVRLRLPTYFCAPNFAFLMVADAYDAVSALRRACAAPRWCWTTTSRRTQINAGVAARAGFAESFAGEAAGELDELRRGLPAQGRAGRDRPGVPAAAGRGPTRRAGGAHPGRSAAVGASWTGCAGGGPSSGCRTDDGAAAGRPRYRCSHRGAGACRCTCAGPG